MSFIDDAIIRSIILLRNDRIHRLGSRLSGEKIIWKGKGNFLKYMDISKFLHKLVQTNWSSIFQFHLIYEQNDKKNQYKKKTNIS